HTHAGQVPQRVGHVLQHGDPGGLELGGVADEGDGLDQLEAGRAHPHADAGLVGAAVVVEPPVGRLGGVGALVGGVGHAVVVAVLGGAALVRRDAAVVRAV